MAVTKLRDALLGVLPETYHYIAPQQKPAKYIVWGETSVSHEVDADNLTQIVLVSGELWLYTQEEYDPLVQSVTDALDEVGASWRISNIGRETDTGMIVYGFVWGIPCGNGEIY